MYNLINTHTRAREWHKMTRMTGPDCAVMCKLIKHTHIHTHTLKKRKKPQNSYRRRAGNGGDMGGKRKKM